MSEPITKFYGAKANTADHPFDDVAVMAKYASWFAGIMAVIGSSLLSVIQAALANGAAAILKIQQALREFFRYAGSILSLSLQPILMLLRSNGDAKLGFLFSIFGALKFLLSRLHLWLFSVGLCCGLAIRLMVCSTSLRALLVKIGYAPPLPVGLIGFPLFFGAIALLHHTSRIFLSSCMIVYLSTYPHAPAPKEGVRT